MERSTSPPHTDLPRTHTVCAEADHISGRPNGHVVSSQRTETDVNQNEQSRVICESSNLPSDSLTQVQGTTDVSTINSNEGPDTEHSTIIIDGKPDSKAQTPSVKGKNTSLNRESRGCFHLVFYTSMFVMMDLWKQVTSYGMKYYNGDMYPTSPTQIVAVTELIKLSLFLVNLVWNGKLTSVRISIYYLVPSFLYAVNNNIYYFALHYTTPPVWNVITQLRIIFMAISYRVFFKRLLTPVQWVALLILMGAIALAKLSGAQVEGDHGHFLIIFALAVFGSSIAVLGSICIEYLFKNDDRSFAEMQMQLYLFGSISAIFFLLIEIKTRTVQPEVVGNPNLIGILVTLCVLFSVTAGVSTASIMKKLDNIVKLYTQSLSNMLTSIACLFFFPNSFRGDFLFFLSLFLVFIAIFLYEHQNITRNELVDMVQKFRSLFRNFCFQVCLVVVVGLMAIMVVVLKSVRQQPVVATPTSSVATVTSEFVGDFPKAISYLLEKKGV